MTSTTVDGRISRATATRAPGPAPGATRGTALRLTRRGRAAVVLVALFAALVVLAMRGAPAASTDVVNHPHLQTVVVTPGDTLWSIAHRILAGVRPAGDGGRDRASQRAPRRRHHHRRPAAARATLKGLDPNFGFP